MSEASTHNFTTSCGWFSFRPKWLQIMNKPWYFLIAVSLAAFFQGAMSNGFVNVSLTTIERRFGLTSKLVGMIPLSSAIGGTLSVIPISYIGGRVSQTRTLGLSIFIIAVGAVLMCLPHFITLNEASSMDVLKESKFTSLGFCQSGTEVRRVLTFLWKIE